MNDCFSIPFYFFYSELAKYDNGFLDDFLYNMVGWMSGFNIGLELRYWALADGRGFIPKDDQDTGHRNFDPPRRGWLPRFGTPRGLIWMVSWRKLYSRRILHAPGTISLHGSFRQASFELGASGRS